MKNPEYQKVLQQLDKAISSRLRRHVKEEKPTTTWGKMQKTAKSIWETGKALFGRR